MIATLRIGFVQFDFYIDWLPFKNANLIALINFNFLIYKDGVSTGATLLGIGFAIRIKTK